MPDTLKPGRGGKRPGAGRKPLPPSEKREPLTLYLKPALLAWIEEHGGAAYAERVLERDQGEARII